MNVQRAYDLRMATALMARRQARVRRTSLLAIGAATSSASCAAGSDGSW